MGSIAASALLLAMLTGTPQDASVLAKQLLETGASSFESKDVAAMAGSYTTDAEIFFLAREDGSFQTQQYRGKERIQQLYTDLFKAAERIESRNVVEYARFVGPDILVIAGTFEPDIGGSLMLQFVQIRIREDDGIWRIRNLQLVSIPNP